MAGSPSPTRTQQSPERSRLRVPTRSLSLRTAIIVFVCLLILFRWLHLILALQLASTGRQIQIATEELQKIERHNATLVREISAAEAPPNLAAQAVEQGYGPRQVLYLRTDLPLAQPTAGAERRWAIDQAGAGVTTEGQLPSSWDVLGQGPGVRAQSETAP